MMTEPQHFLIDRADTPVGEMIIVADEQGRMRALGWSDLEERLTGPLVILYRKSGYTLTPKRDPGGLTTAMRRYFAGDLAIIDTLPIETGGTPFQRAAWSALRKVPCGTTRTYAEHARLIGKPAAIRAVGTANGANPISVVVPCHRLVGADGSLVKYGGGLKRKEWLLAHEGARDRNSRA